jgi:hypothetical protein
VTSTGPSQSAPRRRQARIARVAHGVGRRDGRLDLAVADAELSRDDALRRHGRRAQKAGADRDTQPATARIDRRTSLRGIRHHVPLAIDAFDFRHALRGPPRALALIVDERGIAVDRAAEIFTSLGAIDFMNSIIACLSLSGMFADSIS